MKRILLSIFAVLVLSVAIAYAVPLTPGMGIAPDQMRQADSWHSFGGFQLSTTTITVGAQSVWYPVHNATDNLWVETNGSGLSISADNLVIANKGHYLGHVVISVSGTSGDDIFIRSLFDSSV